MIGKFTDVIEGHGLYRILYGFHHGDDGVGHRGLGASRHGIRGEKPDPTVERTREVEENVTRIQSLTLESHR